ncbi:M48 family metalloprotease [Chryseosolibacter indicus]|uniref:M48 family metalloprotease n=1 Tax=Chryseosolibacter indicus TaxID=2782351 RepID=A0ABS5VNV8_9BACT|nr:M48 family metalloprotease [Chryseosolibacter indicus]MBT1701686.1 M48 family metalloprotease [Chryseosolibacter indicus]
MKRLFVQFFIIIGLLLVDSCAKNPVTGKRDFMLMSEGQEVAMGQQSDPEIIAYMGLYEDPRLQRFIDEKGQQMVAVSHRKNLKYQFKIVDSPIVNAFAVPGGYVYFTRGIMAHFNNEAEFAGVLGHEIGHITARHSAKQYSNAMLGQVGLVAGAVISPEFAQMADVAQQGLSLLFLKFGRDAESQSDKLGVEYSTKIGYDAKEMASFFSTLDRLSKVSGAEEIPTFLSTHPDPADREEKVGKQAANWQKQVDASTLKVNRDSYLKMIDGIVYGEDPKQGFIENNHFYHPVLKFQFPIPAGWKVENTPQQVQMADSEGKAVMMLSLAKPNTLEAAGQSLLEQYQLTLVESKRDEVNGLNAFIMIADQKAQDQQQATVRTMIYLIEYNGSIYTTIGASAITDFNTYFDTFQNTMRNFRQLTDSEKLSRQPERVRIKTVQQNATLNQVFNSFNVPEKRREELAVLNGMKLEDRVNKGMLIKVVERDNGSISVRR